MPPLTGTWPIEGTRRADETVPSVQQHKSPDLPQLSTISSSTRTLPLELPQLRSSHSEDDGDAFCDGLYNIDESPSNPQHLPASQARPVFHDTRSIISHPKPTTEQPKFRLPSSQAGGLPRNPCATPPSTNKKRRQIEDLESVADENRARRKRSSNQKLSTRERMDQERERRQREKDDQQHAITKLFGHQQQAQVTTFATIPQDLETTLQQLPRTLQSLTDILVGPQSPMMLMRNLAVKVNEQQDHIEKLERKLRDLQEHVHVSFTTQEKQTKAAIGEMSDKCNEVLMELDRASPLRVPGGPYGGTPFREPQKRLGFLKSVFPSEQRRRVVQPGSADY